MFFRQLLFEENYDYLPSAGLQVGLGYPLVEGSLIFSKQFSFLTPYMALRAAGIYEGEGIWGVNGGIQLTYSEADQYGEGKISLLLEIFYGRIYRGLIFEGPEIYHGFALGTGLKFE